MSSDNTPSQYTLEPYIFNEKKFRIQYARYLLELLIKKQKGRAYDNQQGLHENNEIKQTTTNE